MITQIFVQSLIADARAHTKNQKAQELRFKTKFEIIAVVDVFTLKHSLQKSQLNLVLPLFFNPISQSISIDTIPLNEKAHWVIEIGFLPGVTDNVASTAKAALTDALKKSASSIKGVWSSYCLFVHGSLSQTEVMQIATLFANPLIQSIQIKSIKELKKNSAVIVPEVHLESSGKVLHVDLSVDDAQLIKIGKEGIVNPDGSRRGSLALDLQYMKAIQAYFTNIGRQPTDIELESIAQTWSEHCKHTIFADPLDELKDGLFRSYIKKATTEILKDKKKREFCVSLFTDNSGAVAFDDTYLVTDKVETHNSPSALDPFGGAITGIVGVNRDALGFGLGAKPILNRYGFCFAPASMTMPLYRDQQQKQPLLSAERIAEGVIAGVNSGGNCSGIPTPQGFVYYDKRYRGKPLVFVGTVGMIPRTLGKKKLYEKQAEPGDYIVVIGGRVGLDGIHGATFSSESLTSHSPATAVQIGDPITQKKLSDALVKVARDELLYTSITDNGAGGLSCSVAEMAKESGGFEVDLDLIPVKYAGLEPWQVWISESQERMTLSVPKKKWKKFASLMEQHGVEATVIGTFTDSGRCQVLSRGKLIMDMEMEFLHDGLPPRVMNSVEPRQLLNNPVSKEISLQKTFIELLARPSIASTAFISQQFDHEVQATSVLKPLQGRGRVSADATVIRPLAESYKGVAVSQALFPGYSEIHPYQMAGNSIDAAIRQLVTIGTDLDQIALLDNFCWCSSTQPERLWQLKEAARACYDFAKAYQTPFISGKDSMFNDFKGFDGHGKPVNISVPPTLLISSLAVMDDVRQAISLDLKIAGDYLYVLGDTDRELGGSEFFRLIADKQKTEDTGKKLSEVDAKKNVLLYREYYLAVKRNLIASAVSVGRGGLVTALAKMSMAGLLGVDADLSAVPGNWKSDEEVLFSESSGRIVVSVAEKNHLLFESIFKKSNIARIGKVTAEPIFQVKTKKKANVVTLSLAELQKAYFSTSPSTHPQQKHDGLHAKNSTLSPTAIVLTGYGLNCEEETAAAFQEAGSNVHIVHINDLIDRPNVLKNAQILAVPGGFSFGDDLGSGAAYAYKLKSNLWKELEDFVSKDRLVIGICNGCQVLVNMGLLPALNHQFGEREIALIHNDNALYTDRWVDLELEGTSPWFSEMSTLSLPIAHGEGKFYASAQLLAQLEESGQVAARYVQGEMCRYQQLPANPNGSLHNIAALTDPSGKILGIMPHPERARLFTHLPNWTLIREQFGREGKRIPEKGPGQQLFDNAVKYFKY